MCADSVIGTLHDLKKIIALIFPTLLLSIHLNVRNSGAGFSRQFNEEVNKRLTHKTNF